MKKAIKATLTGVLAAGLLSACAERSTNNACTDNKAKLAEIEGSLKDLGCLTVTTNNRQTITNFNCKNLEDKTTAKDLEDLNEIDKNLNAWNVTVQKLNDSRCLSKQAMVSSQKASIRLKASQLKVQGKANRIIEQQKLSEDQIRQQQAKDNIDASDKGAESLGVKPPQTEEDKVQIVVTEDVEAAKKIAEEHAAEAAKLEEEAAVAIAAQEKAEAEMNLALQEADQAGLAADQASEAEKAKLQAASIEAERILAKAEEDAEKIRAHALEIQQQAEAQRVVAAEAQQQLEAAKIQALEDIEIAKVESREEAEKAAVDAEKVQKQVEATAEETAEIAAQSLEDLEDAKKIVAEIKDVDSRAKIEAQIEARKDQEVELRKELRASVDESIKASLEKLTTFRYRKLNGLYNLAGSFMTSLGNKIKDNSSEYKVVGNALQNGDVTQYLTRVVSEPVDFVVTYKAYKKNPKAVLKFLKELQIELKGKVGLTEDSLFDQVVKTSNALATQAKAVIPGSVGQIENNENSKFINGLLQAIDTVDAKITSEIEARTETPVEEPAAVDSKEKAEAVQKSEVRMPKEADSLSNEGA